MSTRSRRELAVTADILDRVHLTRYTMDNPELEREIIGLFMAQLPATMAMLKTAASPADWKLATHTLKGSAAAVGATRINGLAAKLEKVEFDVDERAGCDLIVALETAIAQFSRAVGRIYR
jgi:HPt (histidine-containing phosphotransfer) domain-containing protein